jgi:hypothetical protein
VTYTFETGGGGRVALHPNYARKYFTCLDKHLSLSLCMFNSFFLNSKLREIKNQLIKKSAKQIRKFVFASSFFVSF